MLRERIYIQTDKQTYFAGELIWMKLYLTDANGLPASFSKVGYVELLNESTAQVQAKVELSDGIGTGWMELPTTLSSGHYRLVAYTRQMTNEGEQVFFNKPVHIINTFKADELIKTDSSVRMLPEPVFDNNIVVHTDKKYATRSRNNIQIEGLPGNIHSLCISVAGKDLINESKNITQWKKEIVALPQSPFQIEQIPEYEGHIISGKILNLATGKTIRAEENIVPLLGFVGDQIRIFNGKTNDKGNVLFFTKRITGRNELATCAFSSTENKYRVDITSPFYTHSESSSRPFTINPGWEKQLVQRSVGLQALYAYTADSLNRMDTTFAHFQWKPDRSYILDEYTRFTRMDEVVIEFIPSLRFRKIGNKRVLSVLMEDSESFTIGNTLVLLDGIPVLDHEIIYNYDPLLVYKINVYKNRFDFGDQFFDGIASFITYKNNYPTLTVDEQTQLYDYEGTQANRLFYAPTYLNENEKTSRIPDFRHTLLWNPHIKTDGKSNLQIPFTTSDLTGEFQVIVEGITTDGNVIRGTTFFNVTE